jgi:sulfur-oxidizing protein SoxY
MNLMASTKTSSGEPRVTRRLFIKVTVAAAGLVSAWETLVAGGQILAQASPPGWPVADEPVEATLKRLFGMRTFNSGEGKIKIVLPAIAEDGGNVPISVDAELPVSGANRVNHIYIISDKNRRPMLAKYAFSADSGRAAIATSIRLATTTDVRAIVEMNDGALYAVTRHVRVTVSGCDLPPQS